MARIRTIKPEFCTSEQIVECSTSARLLFVTMWCFCDDAGRHPANVRRLKMECFPGDDFTLAEIQGFVDELVSAKLLIVYAHEERDFWQVTGWKHQKIDRPTYKYGPFDGQGKPCKFEEHSSSDRRVIDDQSPPEGSLRESKGRESSGVDDKSSTPTVSDKTSSVQRSPPSVDEIRAYMKSMGYPDNSEALSDHYSANGWVQGRGKPIKDWKAAVRNWQRNDFGNKRQSPDEKARSKVASMADLKNWNGNG